MTIADQTVEKTGRLAPGLYGLGNHHTPCFLLEGSQPVLIEGGLSCLTRHYLKDARELLNGRQPSHLFLTHAHYDHCGAAGYLKKAFPQMEICAAAKAASIVTRPNAIKLITQLNQEVARYAQTLGLEDPSLEDFVPFEVERVLDDGEEVELEGGLTIRALATPGHTWDSMSYYVPQRGYLFCGEALGTDRNDGYLVTELLVGYDVYEQSILKLAELEVEVICQGHYTVHSGKVARDYFRRALDSTREFKQWVFDILEQEGGDVRRTMQRVKEGEWDPKPEPKQPLPAYLLNLEPRIKCMAQSAGYDPQG